MITQQLQLCLRSTAKFEAAAAQTADGCKRFALGVVSVLDSHEHSAVKLLFAALYGEDKMLEKGNAIICFSEPFQSISVATITAILSNLVQRTQIQWKRVGCYTTLFTLPPSFCVVARFSKIQMGV